MPYSKFGTNPKFRRNKSPPSSGSNPSKKLAGVDGKLEQIFKLQGVRSRKHVLYLKTEYNTFLVHPF
jgi:hypothetical protein